MPPKKRKYFDDYVKLGFTFLSEKDGNKKPQCFICGNVFCNDSMKPSKLKEHLTSSHPGNVDDTEEQFRQKKARFETFGTLLNLGFAQTQKPALEASFNVAYRMPSRRNHILPEFDFRLVPPLRQ